MSLRNRVSRSTPLRLTAIFLGIFILSSAVSFGAAYVVIRANFDTTLEDEIEQTLDSYRAIGNQDALVRRLSEDVTFTESDLTILHYLPDSGAVIANVDAFPPVSGYTIVGKNAIDEGEHDAADSYFADSARVGRGQLIVARTREQIIEMGEIILAVVLIGLLPTILLAGIAGALAARNVRRRINTIQTTLAELTAGRPAARVPSRIGTATT